MSEAGEGNPLVLVISAWHDDGSIRARVVHGTRGGRDQTVACSSVDDLLATVRALVDAWDATRDDDGR